MIKKIAMLGFSAASLLVSNGALADWQLNNDQSTVSFVSVKNNSIAEVHHFKALSGNLKDNGSFKVNIDLNSVETMIPVRNERIAKFLFESVKFPTATLSADLSKQLKNMTTGQHILKGVKAELSFHGQTKELTTDLMANMSDNGDISVSSISPLIINAADYDVTAGIAKLQELAGLSAIANAVPVSYSLTLKKEK